MTLEEKYEILKEYTGKLFIYCRNHGCEYKKFGNGGEIPKCELEMCALFWNELIDLFSYKMIMEYECWKYAKLAEGEDDK